MTGYVVQGLVVCVLGLSVIFPLAVFADTFNVTTGYPSGTSGTMRTLNGYVDSSTNESITAWFDYGANGSFQASSYKSGFSGGGDLSSLITHLTPGVEYVYRAVARKDKSGQVVYGETKKFTVMSGQAGSVSTVASGSGGGSVNTGSGGSSGVQPVASSGLDPVVASDDHADLNATVVAGSFPVTVWFEWGPTSLLGNETTHQNLQTGPTLITMKDTVRGLKPATTYYYRAVAVTANGRGNSPVMSFLTTGSESLAGSTSGTQGDTNTQTVTSSSIAFGDVSQGTTVVTSNTDNAIPFGQKNTGSSNGQMASALGWGSILQDQFFTIDENGRIASANSFAANSNSGSSLFANIFSFGGILPHSFFGWLAWVVIAYIALAQIQQFYARREKRKLEKEEQEKATQEAKKYQDFAIKNKKIA